MSDWASLHPICQMVLREHPVRKGKARKAAFRAALTKALAEQGLTATVRKDGKRFKNHNLVVGDVEKAKLLLTAHYDTPARLPFPNFVTPKNPVVTLGYGLLLGILGGALFMALMLGGAALGIPFFVRYTLLWVLIIAAVWLMLAGPANPSNVNDNTSGVVTALEALLAMSPEDRAQTAVILFDNEELGMIGSSAFRARCPTARQKPLINFDCVGEGNTILLAARAAGKGDASIVQKLKQAFAGPGDEIQVLVDTSPFTLHPSDHMGFRLGIGVAAMRKMPLVGYGISRIHTKRDRVLQTENVHFLAAGCARFLRTLP